MASSHYPDPSPTDLLSSVATFHLLPTTSPSIYHTLISHLDRMVINLESRTAFVSLFERANADIQRRVYELCYQDSRVRDSAKYLALLWPRLNKGVQLDFYTDRFTATEREMVVSHAYWELFNKDAAEWGMEFDPDDEVHASWIETQIGCGKEDQTDNTRQIRTKIEAVR